MFSSFQASVGAVIIFEGGKENRHSPDSKYFSTAERVNDTAGERLLIFSSHTF